MQAPVEAMVLLDGSTRNGSDFEGRVRLVNFWATSCAPCVAEMPALAASYRKFQDRKFSLVAIAMQYDPPSYVVHFAQTRDLPFPVAIDNTGALALAWGGVGGTPTSFLVNKRGQIVKRIEGTPDFRALNSLIEGLLEEH